MYYCSSYNSGHFIPNIQKIYKSKRKRMGNNKSLNKNEEIYMERTITNFHCLIHPTSSHLLSVYDKWGI